ncbi:MAG TPA: HAD family hydrolase [Nocardioidaceae bacterium]|nr:HAD family hydrolase [Nocardioidaceae bacterium]
MGNQHVDHVVFDCDGVLVDTEPLSIEVDRQVLAELGWNLTPEEIVDRFVGRSHEHFLAEVARHVGHPLPPGWGAEITPRYREAFTASLRPVDGIVEALARISLPSCVASSGSHEKMAFTLGLTGLLDRFDGRLFSATEVEHGKPAPDLFLFAAAQMGWQPASCVVVEDSAAGVDAGLAAGMRVIAYAGGVTPASRLTRPGVTVITDMHDLPDAIAAVQGQGKVA